MSPIEIASLSLQEARKALEDAEARFRSYDGGDRAPSPPVSLILDIEHLESRIRWLTSWKDESSHERGAVDRTPNVWTCRIDGGRITIHRWHHGDPSRWHVSAYVWGGTIADHVELPEGLDLERAWRAGLELVHERLHAAASRIAHLLRAP